MEPSVSSSARCLLSQAGSGELLHPPYKAGGTVWALSGLGLKLINAQTMYPIPAILATMGILGQLFWSLWILGIPSTSKVPLK